MARHGRLNQKLMPCTALQRWQESRCVLVGVGVGGRKRKVSFWACGGVAESLIVTVRHQSAVRSVCSDARRKLSN